jgi:hypothetical protein
MLARHLICPIESAHLAAGIGTAILPSIFLLQSSILLP